MSESSYIKCAGCGELIEVPPELLGDQKTDEVEGYLCDGCETDGDDIRYDFGEDDWDEPDWTDYFGDEEDDPDDYCPHCGKEYEEWGDLGCEYCDRRHPHYGEGA